MSPYRHAEVPVREPEPARPKKSRYDRFIDRFFPFCLSCLGRDCHCWNNPLTTTLIVFSPVWLWIFMGVMAVCILGWPR